MATGAGGFLESRKPLAIVVAAALAALGGLLVSRYVPDLLERVEEPQAVVAQATYDPSLYSTCGWSAVLPAGVDTARPPPSTDPDEVLAWVLDSGGAPLGETSLVLRLRGTRSSPVQVVGMTAVVAERAEPLAGGRVVIPCEGEVPAVPVGFDLDEPTPVARTVEADGLGTPYFSTGLVTLDRDETVPFAVSGLTDLSLVRWGIEVDTVVDGEPGVVSTGATFVTSAGPGPGPGDWYLLTIDGLRWWNDATACAELGASISGLPCG